MSQGVVYCQHCGSQMSADAEACPDCGGTESDHTGGSASRSSGERENKSPWFAALLSLLVAGTGQMYLGRWTRGLAIIVLGVGLSVLVHMAAPLFTPVLALYPVLAAIDAFLLTDVVMRPD